MKLIEYLQDGACMQARCVLCYLQTNVCIFEDDEDPYKIKTGDIEVGRWENCREQGYCVSLAKNGISLNIIFFEHRNSDSICAVKWQENGMINTPSLDSPELKKTKWYNDKFAVDKKVPYMHIREMGDWILNEFKQFIKTDDEIPE